MLTYGQKRQLYDVLGWERAVKNVKNNMFLDKSSMKTYSSRPWKQNQDWKKGIKGL